MKSWKSIWNAKSLQSKEKISISDLIKLDGFDTGFGSYDEVSWVEMVRDFVNIVNLHPNSNVYEIGCGAGCFLYTIKQIIEINCFGIDYSKNLIDIAKRVIPEGKFLEECELHKFQERKIERISDKEAKNNLGSISLGYFTITPIGIEKIPIIQRQILKSSKNKKINRNCIRYKKFYW